MVHFGPAVWPVGGECYRFWSFQTRSGLQWGSVPRSEIVSPGSDYCYESWTMSLEKTPVVCSAFFFSFNPKRPYCFQDSKDSIRTRYFIKFYYHWFKNHCHCHYHWNLRNCLIQPPQELPLLPPSPCTSQNRPRPSFFYIVINDVTILILLLPGKKWIYIKRDFFYTISGIGDDWWCEIVMKWLVLLTSSQWPQDADDLARNSATRGSLAAC